MNREGVRLAVDWGQARIGVAACDPSGTLAYPVATLPSRADWIGAVTGLVAEYEPIEVLFGLPRNLAGQEGPAARNVRERAVELAAALSVPVLLVDERLSTSAASRLLALAGRDTRKQRSIIDQAAAVAILEAALDSAGRGLDYGERVQTDGSE